MEILTERNRESGDNITTHEQKQMTVVNMKISLVLQNHPTQYDVFGAV